jgi:hypothetical protein
MNLNKRIKDNHMIPKIQFVTLGILGIKIHQADMKEVVLVKDRQLKPQWIWPTRQ